MRINNPILSLENESGGKTYVVEDDGGYVAYNNIGDTDKFVSITHLYPDIVFNTLFRGLGIIHIKSPMDIEIEFFHPEIVRLEFDTVNTAFQ